MMGQHGFISWANDDKECYLRTLDFIEKASQFIEAKYAGQRRRHEGVWRSEISDPRAGNTP